MEDFRSSDSATGPEFRAPTLRETYGRAPYIAVFVLLLVQGAALVAVAFFLAGVETGYTLLCGLALICIAITVWLWVLSLNHARIILTADRLVEYNHFNHMREFSYDQICDAGLGRHSGEVWIRCVPEIHGGDIDFKHTRTINLVTVKNSRELYRELAMRMTIQIPESIKNREKARILMLVLVVFLVVNLLFVWMYWQSNR